jgi:hypothetical protein
MSKGLSISIFQQKSLATNEDYLGSSDVKADWNCLFSIFAFSDGFECRVPSLRRGAMPVFSFFWLFM